MGRGRRTYAPALAAACLLLPPAIPAGATGTAAPAAPLRRTANVLPAAALNNPLGPVDAAAPVSIAVQLELPRRAERHSLAAAVVDPGDRRYRSFLTPGQYAARFALPPGTQRRVHRWLAAGGLRVAYASPLGDLVQATGTAAQVERLFRLRLGTYGLGAHGRGAAARTFRANDVAPAVPAGLPVTDVVGLNDLERFAPAAARTVAAPGPGTVHVKDLWTAYGAPAGNGGEGVPIGVVMAGNPKAVVGSLRAFEAAEGLPRVPVRTVTAQAGPTDRYPNTFASEWMLDTQAATGMAPRVPRLDLYAARSLEAPDVVAIFSRWANDARGPEMLSASIAYCEAVPFGPPPVEAGVASLELGNRVQAGVEQALMQAFTEGRTLFAGAGDSGSSCQALSVGGVGSGNGFVNQAVPLQGYPASSPYATAVGGTVLDLAADGRRRDERAWGFTGGGASLFVPAPAWQRAEPNVDLPCLLTDGQGVPQRPGTLCRGVPDLAALSGNTPLGGRGQGLAVLVYDAPTVVAGTSLSTPLAMGMWARVAAAAAKPLGPAAPAVYGLPPEARARAFHDITAGELLGNGAYLTGPGWDYTSGYGVPEIAALAEALTGSRRARVTSVRAQASEPPSGDAVACLPFATSPAGNVDEASFGDQTLDVTDASMASGPGAGSLVITVRGPRLDLSPTPPGAPASAVRVLWTYDGATYVAQAVTDAVGLRAVAGRLTGDPAAPSQTKPVTAVARPGSLTITVPLGVVGAAPEGARLRYPVVLSGVTNGTGPGDRIDVADVAGPDRDHTLGQSCRGAGRGDPATSS